MKNIIIKFNNDTSSIKFVYNDSRKAKLAELLELCKSNELATVLLSSLAEKYPDLSVVLTKTTQKGVWLPETHVIKINPNLSPCELLQTFIFECCNAMNPKFKNKVNMSLFSKAEDYAEYVEHYEFLSYQLAYKIYSHGIKTAKWPKPENSSYLETLLKKEVWMEDSKQKKSDLPGVNSHFGRYVDRFNNKKNEEESSKEETSNSPMENVSSQEKPAITRPFL